MYQAEIHQLTYQGLMLILILSAPPIFISLIFGLSVAIFQAATQIQEMTLSFIPKLLALVVVLFVVGPWMLRIIVTFSERLFTDIPGLVG